MVERENWTDTPQKTITHTHYQQFTGTNDIEHSDCTTKGICTKINIPIKHAMQDAPI